MSHNAIDLNALTLCVRPTDRPTYDELISASPSSAVLSCSRSRSRTKEGRKRKPLFNLSSDPSAVCQSLSLFCHSCHAIQISPTSSLLKQIPRAIWRQKATTRGAYARRKGVAAAAIMRFMATNIFGEDIRISSARKQSPICLLVTAISEQSIIHRWAG